MIFRESAHISGAGREYPEAGQHARHGAGAGDQGALAHIFHIEDMPHVAIDYLEHVSKRINEQVLDEVFRVYGESMVEVLKLYRKVGTMDNYRHFHTYFRNLEHLSRT